MSRQLPTLRPQEIIRTLERAGFIELRRTGSHAIMWKEGRTRPVPIPVHSRGISRKLLLRIIKEAGLTQEAFLDYLP
ncbi:MAG: type II toxin-antitoxin system HicA family toxin [Chloroflexi bacterium]|nr:type II toxin-antitoxin system HicA family toxin [Chloroflexota bacterium]MBI3733805.1 type II toxin-antitoxin system HicA family toxin [Chloroflexota bacterium]